MPASLNYRENFNEKSWGATFSLIESNSDAENIFVCHANIWDLQQIANKLASRVTDKSWIIDLDQRARRAYEDTAGRTAKKLVRIFKGNLTDKENVKSEFGELMVSMGSAKALEVVFEHRSLPLAELWKPNLSQNEGFDFHTICKGKIVNFGEAKFSSSSNPYGGNSGDTSGAGGQADKFIEDAKHLMDNVHLGSIAGETEASNLDNDIFGIVLGFSINAKNPLLILTRALENTLIYENLKKAKNIYIVGVSYDNSGS